jgi:murein DD-endopeptidase
MMIKWDAVFQNEKRQFEKMTEQDKFVYFLLLQFNSPYGWGKENPESSDCSGAVCLALYAATGVLVRVTADVLYKRVFTVINPGAGMIQAAFFVQEKTGVATHIAGILENGIILNSQEGGARIRRLSDISDWFQKEKQGTAIRGLDRAALERLAAEGSARNDLDLELSRYMEV